MSYRLRTIPILAVIGAAVLSGPAAARDLIVIDGPIRAKEVKCDDCVDRRDIGNNAVGSGELTNDAVTPEKIKDGAVRTGKIEDGAVTTDKIADRAVTLDKLDIDFDEENDIAPFRVLNNTGGLCDEEGPATSTAQIQIDNTGVDEFVVTGILIKTDVEGTTSSPIYVSINSVTINDFRFDTRTDNVVKPGSVQGAMLSADLMGTPVRLGPLGTSPQGPGSGGNFPHQIVAGATSDGADIRVTLFCRSDDTDVAITAIEVSGWKSRDDTVTVRYAGPG
jgi:hypothetical protein